MLLLTLAFFMRRVYQRHLLAMASHERERAEKQRRIQQAVRGVTELKFPLAVMPLSELKKQVHIVTPRVYPSRYSHPFRLHSHRSR